MFHISADLFNTIVAWQTTDWLVPNSQISPTDIIATNILILFLSQCIFF